MNPAEATLFDHCADALLDIHLLMNGAIKLYEDEGREIGLALRKTDSQQMCRAISGIGQALYLSLERAENALYKVDSFFASAGEQREEKPEPPSP